ncbi:hypothetical protein CAPTEDRAFT_218468 [Capitella teleta]|uniref:Uncharacterized protein n=1 Tax=Capitella teleta TaxID=283909 RepID=R7VM16_CAPTE|nr:hypothetical protein CAPTEDRAFT_218468 [Capitella teleta]|eukprot:ELU18741.1 hypothetical protein CAPTEDRAFT_218468 [Capitella teleta]
MSRKRRSFVQQANFINCPSRARTPALLNGLTVDSGLPNRMHTEGVLSVEYVELLLKTQQTAFQGFFHTFMDSNNNRVNGVLTSLIKLKRAPAVVPDRIQHLLGRDYKVSTTVEHIEDKINIIDVQCDYLKNQSHRNNLHVDGIPKDPQESWVGTEDKKVHKTGKNHPLHLACAPDGSCNHSMVVTFNSFKDRDSVLKRAKERRPHLLFLSEDFSRRVLEVHRSHLPSLKRHKEEGGIAYLTFNKLIVRDGHWPLQPSQSPPLSQTPLLYQMPLSF